MASILVTDPAGSMPGTGVGASRGAERRDHGGLRVIADDDSIDVDAAETAIRDLILALGRDPDSGTMCGTPQRAAKAFRELLTSESFELTTFPNDEHYDELVLVRDIPFSSLCEHHLLPFHGVAHVGYLPAERIVGLSKLARVVKFFAADFQTQERLTVQVADWIDDHLQPEFVGVVVEADHECMTVRGVRVDGARTFTSALRGILRDDACFRQEFFALAGGGIPGGRT